MKASRNGMLGRNDWEDESSRNHSGRKEGTEGKVREQGLAGTSHSGRHCGGNGAQVPAFTSEPNPPPRWHHLFLQRVRYWWPEHLLLSPGGVERPPDTPVQRWMWFFMVFSPQNVLFLRKELSVRDVTFGSPF